MANLNFVRNNTKKFDREVDFKLYDKNQLDELKICWLEMKNHSAEDIIAQFRKILDKLKVPFSSFIVSSKI